MVNKVSLVKFKLFLNLNKDKFQLFIFRNRYKAIIYIHILQIIQ